jgi:hypothetical protein
MSVEKTADDSLVIEKASLVIQREQFKMLDKQFRDSKKQTIEVFKYY